MFGTEKVSPEQISNINKIVTLKEKEAELKNREAKIMGREAKVSE